MKIRENAGKKSVAFCNLYVGDVFKYRKDNYDEVYMKIPSLVDSASTRYNAIELSTGLPHKFCDGDTVEILEDAEIIF